VAEGVRHAAFTDGENMIEHPEFIHPTHCFCQFSAAELRKWAEKRYIEQHPTIELLQSSDDPHEKEVISAVALLDVDDDVLLAMMGNVDLPEHHILHCRETVKRMLGVDNPKGGN
jgi:hypothetical protein